jgi:hypothetical protein
MKPVLSVVIPAFGRVEPLKCTLRSVAGALRESGRVGEIVLVDDGSPAPLEQALSCFDAAWPLRIVTQGNSGSIVARMTGLEAAQGEFVNFLDSDDLVHPDKFTRQLAAMEGSGVDVTYTDRADVEIGPDYSVREFRPSRTYLTTESSLQLFVTIQPSPHSPIFRRDFLLRALAQPAVPFNRLFDPSGDVWLFRNLALHSAKVRKVPGHFAGIGPHDEARFTNCWEKLGAASLGIDEALMAACAHRPETEELRRLVGAGAFQAFRVLPHSFSENYEKRLLALWRQSPAAAARGGGRGFTLLAGLVGSVNAARLLRRWRRPCYKQCKTLRDAGEFDALLARLPVASPTALGR